MSSYSGMLKGIMKFLIPLLIPTKKGRGRARGLGGSSPVRVPSGNRSRPLPRKGTGSKGFSSGRQPHTSQVIHTRNGQVISDRTLQSGNMTPQEKALGFPRSSLATHTENRAMRDPDLRSGDQVTIRGQYPPCTSCKGAMNDAAGRGVQVEYHWPGAESPWVAGRRR